MSLRPNIIGRGQYWDPYQLGPNLRAWWCADDHGTSRMTDDGAGLISSWIDRIGNLAATGTTTQRPTWASNSLNSLPAVTFDASANQLFTGTTTGLPVATTSGELWCLVGQSALVADTTLRCAIAYGSTAANGTRLLARKVTSGTNRAQASIDRNIAENVADTITDFSGNHIFMAYFDQSGQIIGGRVDGSATTPPTGAMTLMNTGATRVRLGANIDGSGLWNGPGAHYLIITGLQTLAQRQRLEGFLAWNRVLQAILPATHPYRWGRP